MKNVFVRFYLRLLRTREIKKKKIQNVKKNESSGQHILLLLFIKYGFSTKAIRLLLLS